MLKRSILLVALLSLTWLGACKKSDPEPADELTLNFESAHYNYYYANSDVLTLDTQWQEAHYTWVIGRLAVNPASKLNYYKYKNREHLRSMTGQNTNGFAEVGTWNFHSIWHPENHENVHTIVINMIGHPPALFNEGIAVALAPQPIYGAGVFNTAVTWNGLDIDLIARNLKNTNEIPNLSNLLESPSFFQFNTNNTYPMAGSFCKYLLANYSIDQLKTFFAALTFESSASEVNTQFLAAFGASLVSVWDIWLEGL